METTETLSLSGRLAKSEALRFVEHLIIWAQNFLENYLLNFKSSPHRSRILSFPVHINLRQEGSPVSCGVLSDEWINLSVILPGNGQRMHLTHQNNLLLCPIDWYLQLLFECGTAARTVPPNRQNQWQDRILMINLKRKLLDAANFT